MDEISHSWHTYPQIYALGHKALKNLLSGPVLIEEKVDGSQFSFGRFGNELKIRSKGKNIFLDAPEKMFIKAIESVKTIESQLTDGWTYRAEYLQKPKHNVLAYERTPKSHIMVFDINSGHEEYLSYEEKLKEASRLGLETVPVIFQGILTDYSMFQDLLKTMSVLGSQKIEGVVVKNYDQYGPDKKVLMGKFVSEEFKEVHANEWKNSNPSQNDILTTIQNKYKTPARWQKSVQHLKEVGLIEGTPKDIGLLIKEAGSDLLKECESEIIEDLKKWALPHIVRGAVRGLPEWYKEQLAKQQFEN